MRDSGPTVLRVREPAADPSSAGSADVVAGDWPDPVPLGPPPPDPLPLDALPDWLRAHVVSVAESTQTPTDMAYLLGLAAVSTAVAGKAEVQVRPGWREPLNIWTSTPLGPANVKSAVFRKMIEPIEQYEADERMRLAPDVRRSASKRRALEGALATAEKEAAKAYKKSREAYEEALELVNGANRDLENHHDVTEPRFLANDITSEKLPILMAENEGRAAILAPEGDVFRILAGRYSDGTPALGPYKHGWTGHEALRVDRVTRSSVYVPNPILTMGLTVQPAVLETIANRDILRGEGIMGRFLWSAPESPIGSRLTGPDVPLPDPAAADKYAQTLRALLEAHPASALAEDSGEIAFGDGGGFTPLLGLDGTAEAVFNEFWAENERDLGDSGSLEWLLDWGGKLRGNVARLAGLLHLAERAGRGLSLWEGPVSAEAMEAAVAIGRALVPHAITVFDVMGRDVERDLASYVLRRARAANDPDSLTEKEMFDLCGGGGSGGRSEFRTMEDFRGTLAYLEDRGWIRIEVREAGPKGGRPPSPWVRLHPQVRRHNRHNPLKQGISSRDETYEQSEPRRLNPPETWGHVGQTPGSAGCADEGGGSADAIGGDDDYECLEREAIQMEGAAR